jgi:hypothetical protein
MKLTIKSEGVKASYEGSTTLEFDLDLAEVAKLTGILGRAKRALLPAVSALADAVGEEIEKNAPTGPVGLPKPKA